MATDGYAMERIRPICLQLRRVIVPLREMQRAARRTRADTTVSYDQSDRSFHQDPIFVLVTAIALSEPPSPSIVGAPGIFNAICPHEATDTAPPRRLPIRRTQHTAPVRDTRHHAMSSGGT